MKKVLIVEDHSLICFALASLIKDAFRNIETFTAENLENASKILKQQRVDMIMLDLGLPDSQPYETIKRVKQIQKDVPILICSGRDELSNALFYINNGANGYISKNAPCDEILNAVDIVINKKRYISQQVQRQLLDRILNSDNNPVNPVDSLSDRERQILDLIMEGRGIKEIAEGLNLKFSTVSTHKTNIYEKFQVENVLELYKKAVQYL